MPRRMKRAGLREHAPRRRARRACSKVGFPTWEAAMRRVAQLAAAQRAGAATAVVPVRPYRCPACGWWELTSKEVAS